MGLLLVVLGFVLRGGLRHTYTELDLCTKGGLCTIFAFSYRERHARETMGELDTRMNKFRGGV